MIGDIMEKNKNELNTFIDYYQDYPPEIQHRLEEIRQVKELNNGK